MPDDISQAANSIFPDPLTARRAIDFITSKKPMGWSKGSNAPYYDEYYGKPMKEWIDKMISNRQPMIFRYDVWCAESTGVSQNTLYSRINQSILFVRECMDDANKTYEKWFRQVRLSRTEGPWIGIYWKKEFESGMDKTSGLSPEFIQKPSDRVKWEEEMEEWLEGSSNRPLVIEGLALTAEQVTQYKLQLHGLQGIDYSVTHSSIKIIRTN